MVFGQNVFPCFCLAHSFCVYGKFIAITMAMLITIII